MMLSRPALSDRQLARMIFRLDLFQRRGFNEAQAEALADKLATRDFAQDERRDCMECSNLRGMNCAARGLVLRGALQHCPSFNWEVPKQ